jgi:hypothetical protein
MTDVTAIATRVRVVDHLALQVAKALRRGSSLELLTLSAQLFIARGHLERNAVQDVRTLLALRAESPT